MMVNSVDVKVLECTAALNKLFFFQLSVSLYRRVLVILHEKVMPFMTSPLMLADFLTDSYNIGKPCFEKT